MQRIWAGDKSRLLSFAGSFYFSFFFFLFAKEEKCLLCVPSYEHVFDVFSSPQIYFIPSYTHAHTYSYTFSFFFLILFLECSLSFFSIFFLQEFYFGASSKTVCDALFFPSLQWFLALCSSSSISFPCLLSPVFLQERRLRKQFLVGILVTAPNLAKPPRLPRVNYA